MGVIGGEVLPPSTIPPGRLDKGDNAGLVWFLGVIQLLAPPENGFLLQDTNGRLWSNGNKKI